jgi:hypothetical protein
MWGVGQAIKLVLHTYEMRRAAGAAYLFQKQRVYWNFPCTGGPVWELELPRRVVKGISRVKEVGSLFQKL